MGHYYGIIRKSCILEPPHLSFQSSLTLMFCNILIFFFFLRATFNIQLDLTADIFVA